MESLTASYEKTRVPHPVPVNDARVVRTQKEAVSELQCPICFDFFRNTQILKECLHRFCEACITKAVEDGTKECPRCAKKFNLKNMRSDTSMDIIIKGFRQNNVTNGGGNVNAPAQAEVRAFVPVSSGQPVKTVSTGSTGVVQASKVQDFPDIKLVLQPYTKKIVTGEFEAFLDNWKPRSRYLTIKSCATVEHVCRFIIARFLVEGDSVPNVDFNAVDVSNVEVYIRMDHQTEDFVLLPHKFSLEQVWSTYWNIKRPLDLHFSFKGNVNFVKSA